MNSVLVQSALRDYLAADDLAGLALALERQHPADIAGMIADLVPREVWRVLDAIPLATQAETFGYFDHDFQVALARCAPRFRLAQIVTEMNSDERADLFNQLSDDQKEALLPALAQAEREDIRRLAAYEAGTAGAVMTSDYATLTEDLTAPEALNKLRLEAPDKETIYRTYVTDPDRRLIGSVRLQDLILALGGTRIGDIMERNTLAVRVDEDQEQVARQIARYDLLALPVIDGDGRLVGIVTHDDAMDVLQEEATEDFHKVGTVSKLAATVRGASIWALYRARIFWLVLLVFGNIFSGAGIAAFENTIAAYVALVFFLPLLIDSGGNAGSQAATLMVRALATDAVRMGDWGRLIGREVLVALCLGLTMAVAVSFLGIVRGGPEIALVVSASMVAIVLVGSTIGMSLPFVLTRLRLDPAAASAPLVTSIADVAGVMIYFTMATALLDVPASG